MHEEPLPRQLSSELDDTAPAAVQHLYLHIPFCPSKCDYCAFVTHIGSLRLAEPYLGAVEIELDRLLSLRSAGPLETVYLGGGTPSMLTPLQIARLIKAARDRFGLAPGAEITMEAHPATVRRSGLNRYRDAGITRISFGVESLHAGELEALGRPKEAERAITSIRAALHAGFESVAADLMYGLPRQSLASWRDSLQAMAESGVHHLSLYPLMIEPKTVFGRRSREGRLTLPGDDTVVEMYEVACDTLASYGYEHYEVSSWSQPRCASRHNLAYWHNREYYAAGVGAHGYLHPYRTENMRSVTRYIAALRAGRSPVVVSETIDKHARLTETIMLRLRLLREGLQLEEIKREFGVDMNEAHRHVLRELSNAKLIYLDHGVLTLAERAVPLANEIWERLAA